MLSLPRGRDTLPWSSAGAWGEAANGTPKTLQPAQKFGMFLGIRRAGHPSCQEEKGVVSIPRINWGLLLLGGFSHNVNSAYISLILSAVI